MSDNCWCCIDHPPFVPHLCGTCGREFPNTLDRPTCPGKPQ